MRVVVCPPTLALGGTQINAIDLAAAVRDRGHEVTVVATSGPLEERLRERGIPLVTIELPSRGRPSFYAARLLSSVVRQQGIEVVHTYETSPGLEAYFGAVLRRRVPVLSTIMSMSVPRLYPSSLPLTLGTAELADARRERGGAVFLLEPPVDTEHDRPEYDSTEFRAEWNLAADVLTIVIVSRLEHEMKSEGIRTAVDAVGLLAAGEVACRLVVVGGGPARGALSNRAEAVNARAGREVVVFTGPIVDPRPAYAAADVVLGMGGSALRGMAFGKPTVVLGERGFSEVVSPETIGRFFYSGYYGIGTDGSQPELLQRQLSGLADGGLRQTLGQFSRQVVCDRYGLHAAAASVEAMYNELLSRPVKRAQVLPEILRTTTWVAAIKVKQRRSRTG